MRRLVLLSLTKWKCICLNVFLQHFLWKMKYFSISWNWNVSLGFTDLTGSILFDIDSIVIYLFFFSSFSTAAHIAIWKLQSQTCWCHYHLWYRFHSCVVLPHCSSYNSIEALYDLQPWPFSKLNRICSSFTVTLEKQTAFEKVVGRDTARCLFQHKLSHDSAIKSLFKRTGVV